MENPSALGRRDVNYTGEENCIVDNPRREVGIHVVSSETIFISKLGHAFDCRHKSRSQTANALSQVVAGDK